VASVAIVALLTKGNDRDERSLPLAALC